MNKDVIYIEPEDDITDIIAKLKASAEKVVAIVPPKKIGVLSSIINIKLIAKTAKSASKAVVIVTDNASLMKLCREAALPVAANLKSRPSVPSEELIEAAESGKDSRTIAEAAEDAVSEQADAEIAEDFAAQPESASDIFDESEKPAEDVDAKEVEDELAASSADTIELSDDDSAEDEKPAKKDTDKPKSAKSKDANDKKAKPEDEDEEENPSFLKKYGKWLLTGGIGLICIVVFSIWAFVIAPRATIDITVGTTSNNFSENVSFTTTQADEDASSGRFYLETIEKKDTLSAPLTATGEKDLGEKAKGQLSVGYGFKSSDFDEKTGKASVTVKAGTVFTQDGKSYATDKDVTLTAELTKCEWSGSPVRCNASAAVAATATNAGESYNCSAGATWKNGYYYASNAQPFTGGSSKIVKVVQQKDIDTALADIKKLNDSEAKELLKDSLKEGYILIDSSYKATVSDPKSSVEIGAEAADGAKVTEEITYTVYAVDSARVEEYIRAKANLASDQKIYDLGTPYIERFTVADGGNITGKIKTTYRSGPEVTSEIVMNKVKGKKVGEAQSLLKSINGVSNVYIDTSFFWVNSIPDDPNKITINIEVEK